MTPDREREILAHVYGGAGRVTALSGRWATEADGKSVLGCSLIGAWIAPGLEYWPELNEMIITRAESMWLLDRKLFGEGIPGLITSAQGRDAWRRMGSPKPEWLP